MIGLCPKCLGSGKIRVAYYGDEECPVCNGAGRINREITMFLCGPSKCDHDYSKWEEFEHGGTAVCVKCGARAIDEAAWD